MPISILMFFVVVFLCVSLLRMARVGTLAAFLLAGVLSGPYVFDLFQLSRTWAFLGDLGILFLWFNLGLEINIRRLWNLRRSIFGFGAAQVMMVAVMLFPLLFGITRWPILGCIMVALLLAMSSTSEDLKILSERNLLNTNMGRQTFSILLFQDLLAIPLLAMLPVLSGRGFNLGATVIDIFVLSVALLLGGVIVGRFVLNPVLDAVAKLKSKEVFLLTIVLNIIIWATLADFMGLPIGLGVFLAGMLMSETIYRHQVSAEISPYSIMFLAFFFISLGAGLNLPILLHNWYIIIGGLFCLIALKFVAIFMVARVRHIGISDALKIALILAQGGEFGLLMLQTMKTTGIDVLPPPHQEIITAIIVLSIMATPFLLMLYDRVKQSGNLIVVKSERIVGPKNPDVIICGFGRVGQIIARMLKQQGITYIALDLDVNSVMLGRENGFNVVYGDCRNADVLREFGLRSRKTRAVVIALDNASNAHNTILTVRSLAPRVKIFARARNLSDAKMLIRDGALCALPETIESSFFLGHDVLMHMGISDKKIEELLTQLRSNNYAALNKPVSGD